MSWTHYAAPQRFYPLAGRALPWFAVAALLLTLAGLYIGRVGDKSLRYELALFRRDTDECVATGWFVHVFVDPRTRSPVPLTARQKAAVADLVAAGS